LEEENPYHWFVANHLNLQLNGGAAEMLPVRLASGKGMPVHQHPK